MATMDNELRFDFAALPERVWEAMTSPTRAAAWLPDGFVAEVGRRFILPGPGPHRLSGEVIAVDPPSRVALRWRRSTDVGGQVTESVMTWVVDRAPGGACVRVILSPIDDAAVGAELGLALRTLFDERLRTVLRGRARPGAAGPAASPGSAPAQASPPVLVDVATPGGVFDVAASGAVVEGRSQAVSLWPVLRKAKPRPEKPEARRRSGTALAYRLVAVIAIAAAVGAITFGASAIPWATAPGESTLDDGVAATGTSATLDAAAQASLGGNSPGSTSTTAPATGGTPTGTRSTVTAPPLVPPLTVSLEVVNQGALGYTVNVTITNPAESTQAWQNVTVHIDGLNLLITVVGSVVKLLVPGNDACFAPAVATSIGAGQTLEFSFKVTAAAGLSQPTQARLNQGAC